MENCFEIIDVNGKLIKKPESDLKTFVMNFENQSEPEYKFRLSAVSTTNLFFQALFFAFGTGIIVSLFYSLFELSIKKIAKFDIKKVKKRLGLFKKRK